MFAHRLALLWVVVVGVLACTPAVSPAQNYDISWYVLDGGGSTQQATSAGYRMQDAVGQSVIGTCASASYRADLGFLGGGRTVVAQIRIFLEGPYQAAGDSMSTDLNADGVIPLSSPYSQAPRTVSSIPVGVTDWVWVQLRRTSDGVAVSQHSFFLRKDGMVVDTDGGTTALVMSDVGDGDYWLVVRYRNHLAVMSASAQSLSGSNATLYDFTTGSGKYYGTGGAEELEPNVWGLWSGDINQDGEVTTTDYTAWYNSARLGDSGYKTTDINCDAQVTTSDYTVWYNNARSGASSQVP